MQRRKTAYRIKLTVRCHDEEDDQSKSPFEVDTEENQGNTDIEQGRDDVEQDDFQRLVDGGTTIQDAEDLASLAASVPGERQVEKMVEGQLGHF